MYTVTKRWPLVLLLVLLLLLALPQAAFAGYEPIRVLLFSGAIDVLEINTDDGVYELLGANGKYITEIRRNSTVEIEKVSNGYDVYYRGARVANNLAELTLDATDDDCIFEYDGRLYRGSLRMVANGASSYVINVLDLEFYLYGVVGREIGYNQPLEATKAQAVASRSFAVAQLDAGNKYYDIGSGTSSQSYGGYTAEMEGAAGNVIRAVDATAGEVIYYRSDPFPGYYHSNAGGHTEDLANVWGGNIPLKGVPSPYDSYVETSGYSSSIYQWQLNYTAVELRDLAERYGGKSIGTYQGIEISTLNEKGQPSASGRVLEVTIRGSAGEVTARRDAVRSLLGSLKSNLFSLDGATSSSGSLYVLDKGQSAPVLVEDVGSLYIRGSDSLLTRISDWSGSLLLKGAKQSTTYSINGSSSGSNNSGNSGGITIYGKGYGHGAGMSQWGAIGMANDGYSYEDIIEHYYNLDINSDFTLKTY